MILAVDIGTSSLKGGVFTVDGDLVFSHRCPFAHKTDFFDPDLWLDALGRLLVRGEQKAALSRTMITGVVISGHGPTLIPLDREGRPTAPALMWYDGRAVSRRSTSFYLPRAAWFKENCPEEFARTALFLGSSEYLVHRLTGTPLMVTAGESFKKHIWTRGLMDDFGLESSLFPPYVCLGEKSPAVLSREGAGLTGLLQGIPVYGGGSDFFTSLLGAGSVEPGVLCDRAGTSEGLNLICPVKVDHDHIRYLPHPAGGDGVNGSVILSSTGSLFEWYRRLTGQEEWPYNKTMEAICGSSGSRSPRFFPSLSDGGLWEFSGGLFLGMEPDMDRFALGRSVLEAIGFALKRGLDLLERESGPVKRFVVVGGQAKSRLWNQMKADMLGCSIEVPRVADAELLGGLAVFLTGEGAFSSLKEASLALYSTRELVKPVESGYYRERFRKYGELAAEIGEFYRSNRDKLDRL